jgi:prepilin-type N-terminal cleavage/methylation domain-containing protein
MPVQRGFTILEMAVALAIAALLAAGAASASRRYGKEGRARYEASKVVDGLWELRSRATTGMANPCMDFPDSTTVRLYRDASPDPDGFHPSTDVLIRSWTYTGGVKALSVAGGKGATHYVCFEGRGTLGSAGAALSLRLGAHAGAAKTVRLLPSTGVAKVL